MFDGDDLLFVNQTNDIIHSHEGLYNDVVREHYDHVDNDALKFDINDASLAVPVESDDCFHSCQPNTSTNHIDAVIDNVAQQRDNTSWIGYENEPYRAPAGDVDDGIGSSQFNNGPLTDNGGHFADEDRETYAKCTTYDYDRIAYGPATVGANDDLYLQANDVVYNVRRSSAAHLATEFVDGQQPEPQERDLLYTYSTLENNAFDDIVGPDYEALDGYEGGIAFAGQPLIQSADSFYSADEDDVGGCVVYDADSCFYASGDVLDGHYQQLPEEEPSRALLYDAANMTVEMASALRQGGRKGPTTKICEYCGLFLQHPSKIAAHMRTHTGERPFTCEYCGQDFSQRTPYRMHVKRHTGDLPFFCSICRKKFPSNASRNGHEIRVHHKLQRQGAPRPHLKPTAARQRNMAAAELRSAIVNWTQQPYGDLNKPVSDSALRRISGVVDAVAAGMPPLHGGARRVLKHGERRFAEDRHPPTVAQCTECGLIFKHPSKIQAHMRTHTGEKPFVCKECGLGCSTNSALRVHIRRFHTGERPHACTWECGRRFVSVAARNEHERIVHAGIKRYQCTVGNCRRLFTRRSYMIKHLKLHTSESGAAAAAAVHRNDEEATYLQSAVAAPPNMAGGVDQRPLKMDHDDDVDEEVNGAAFYGEPDSRMYAAPSSSVYGDYDAQQTPPTAGLDRFSADESRGFFVDDFYDEEAEMADHTYGDHGYTVKNHPILCDNDGGGGGRELADRR